MGRAHRLVQFTAWVSPELGEQLKEQMRELKAIDHRMTESRIVEDAILDWLPRLRSRMSTLDRRGPALRRL